MGTYKPCGNWTTCTCGKRAYRSRKAARMVAKRKFPHDHLNSYRCEFAPEYWHNGHLRPGDRDRDRRAKRGAHGLQG